MTIPRLPAIATILLLISMMVMSCQSSDPDFGLGIGQQPGAANLGPESDQRVGSGSTVIAFAMTGDGPPAQQSRDVRNGAAMAVEDLADGKLTAVFYGANALTDPNLRDQFKIMRLVVVEGVGNQAVPVGARVPVIELADNHEIRPPNSFAFATSDVDSLAAGMKAVLKAGGVGVVLAPSSEPDNRLNGIRAEIGSGVRIVRYSSNESANVVAKRALSGNGPFVVGILDSTLKAPQLAGALARVPAGKRKTTIVGHSGWGSDILRRREVNGAVIARADSANRSLVSERYRKKFGAQPTMAALYGYDVTAIAAGIVRSAGEKALTRKTLLNSAGFRGATGSFRFHANGTVERLYELTVIQKGKLKILGPAAQSF